jgi:hypothetical protein
MDIIMDAAVILFALLTPALASPPNLRYRMAEYDETTGVTRWTRVVPAAQRENVQQWLLKNYPAVVEVPTPARRKKAA